MVKLKDVKTMEAKIEKFTQNLPFQCEQYFDSVSSTSYHKMHQNQMRKGFDLVREVLSQKETFLRKVDA